MSFWNDLRNDLAERKTASDFTMEVYKKIASSRVNMIAIIKPSFYIGQLSLLSLDFMGYVEKFLNADEGDWGEYLKFILYIRESTKRLLFNVQNLQSPLTELIRMLEEIYEGEKDTSDDGYEDEPEPEDVEKPENVDIDEMLNEEEDKKESPEEETKEVPVSREDMAEDYEALKEELRVKIRQAEVPDRVVNLLSKEIADVYQECVQMQKELSRLAKSPDGDLSTLLSILVDINYGLCYEMKRHLLEDVIVEDRFKFDPGLITWTAHFLADFSDKINEELQMK